MTIVELYRDIRKSSTASVEEMAKMIQKWNVLNESEYIDQDDRARLAHIEVLLFIYYRSLQQEDEKLSYAREHAPHEFGIILSFRQKLADS